jgi:hypothetical protein
MESEMTQKILVIFTVFVFLVMSTTPAVAKKPVESSGNGNTAHENQGNDNPGNKKGDAPVLATPVVVGTGVTISDGVNKTNSVNTANIDTHGFDDSGYNRTARIFNGTAMQWCMEKVGDHLV